MKRILRGANLSIALLSCSSTEMCAWKGFFSSCKLEPFVIITRKEVRISSSAVFSFSVFRTYRQAGWIEWTENNREVNTVKRPPAARKSERARGHMTREIGERKNYHSFLLFRRNDCNVENYLQFTARSRRSAVEIQEKNKMPLNFNKTVHLRSTLVCDFSRETFK